MTEAERIKRRLARQQEYADNKAIKQKTFSRLQSEFESDTSALNKKVLLTRNYK